MGRPHRTISECYVGFRCYYLTICTHERHPFFTNPETVTKVLSHFLRVSADEGFEIVAYCFMPDHLHVIVAATHLTADLQRFVRLAKQRSGFEFTRATGRRLWQDSYFDRVVRSDQALPTLVAYVVDNPRRAGLVETPAEYAYWGSQVYSREQILEFVAAERRV